MDIKNYLINKKYSIDKALDKYLPPSKTRPGVIHETMRYVMFPGGKRIRPILTLASYRACGGKGSSIMAVARAIEAIHTYSLIHDDLPCMDDDDYRRGKLSYHKKFSESLAILTGDALLSFSFELLAKAGDIGIVGEISKAIGSFGTVGGQVEDILSQEKGYKLNKDNLDYIAGRKTGALFEVSVVSAGILKGVDRHKMPALRKFGKYIGLTFQLVDDIMDKDGYVKIYGEDRVKAIAISLTEEAKASLKIFGNKADILLDLADLILDRKM